jgi:hypothetical protein
MNGTTPPRFKRKRIKKLRKQLTEAATKFNDAQFGEALAEVLVHIQYAAYSGCYMWEESCKGWPRDSKVEYVIKKLVDEGFNCYHTAADSIHIEWI